MKIWIICFPWYLSQRYKITHGMAVLKTEAERALDKEGAAVQAWLVERIPTCQFGAWLKSCLSNL